MNSLVSLQDHKSKRGEGQKSSISGHVLQQTRSCSPSDAMVEGRLSTWWSWPERSLFGHQDSDLDACVEQRGSAALEPWTSLPSHLGRQLPGASGSPSSIRPLIQRGLLHALPGGIRALFFKAPALLCFWVGPACVAAGMEPQVGPEKGTVSPSR